MPAPALHQLAPRPNFDAARLSHNCHTGELSAEALESLKALWPDLVDALQGWHIDAPEGSWLLLWLDETLERRIEQAWEDSPSRGFLEHALAVDCVMAAAALEVPELVEAGCAPVPAPCEAVRHAVRELGLSLPEKDTLCRRYSLLTATPWQGGCTTCHMQDDCPRHKTTGPEGSDH